MKITDPDGQNPSTPLYFVNNNVNITSRGQEYQAFSFAIEFYIDDGDRLPTMTIEVDNVTRELVDEVRLVTQPLQVDLELINGEIPDQVEVSVPQMTLRNISYNANSLSGILMLDDVLNQRFPGTRVDPQQYVC
jgi:hypothetical protein